MRAMARVGCSASSSAANGATPGRCRSRRRSWTWTPSMGDFCPSGALGGMLGFLEERFERRLPGVDEESDTTALVERLDQRGGEQVDARAYLRARLVDILVGDWDRHVDQWRWVSFREAGPTRMW